MPLSDLQLKLVEDDAVETAQILLHSTTEELEAELTKLGEGDVMLASIMLIAISRGWDLEQLYRATTFAALRRLRAVQEASKMELATPAQA
jgi:hypothetical protein